MQQQSELYQKDGENASRPPHRRRFLLGLGVVALLLLAGLLAYFLWLRPTSLPQATVRRGTIRGTVVASGEVVSARQAQLSSRVAGQVASVLVEPGDQVISGTVLVTVGADSLRYQVESARLQWEIAQLRLAHAQEGPRPEEIAMAQADLDMAQARLSALVAGPQAEEITITRQEVVQAQVALEQVKGAAEVSVETARLQWQEAANAVRDAQAAYSRIYWENEQLRQRGGKLSQEQQDAEAAAWRQVENAQAAMEQARLAYEQAVQDQQAGLTTAQARLTQARAHLEELLGGASAEELAQAEAQVARAQASLALLQAGPRSTEVEILTRELQQARLAWEQAQADLDKAVVPAPFSATVVEVAAKQGELVGLYSPLVKLADLNQLLIQARIDEIDVGQVAPGQAVTVTLDAFPGQPLQGQVEEIAPAVNVERGSATYLAKISLVVPAGLTLRLGMAASLTIVTVEREDVLLVPRPAVERVGNGYYATVLRGHRRERVRVTLGMSDPASYEVLSGLEEGERVLLPGK